MSEPMNFAIASLLPTNTTQKSGDPIGNDIVKITEEFAKLLIAQITNQDPDKPQDMTDTVTQYSQMLSTIGQIKANNATIQFGQVQIGKDVVGKHIQYSTGTIIQNGKQQDILQDGIVTAVDFSAETPSVYVEGYPTAIAVDKIRSIDNSSQASSVIQSAAQIVGKTVSYGKMVANPAYPGAGQPNPANEPETIMQESTGIVSAVDFSQSATPYLGISGETDPIPLTSITKIYN